MQVIDFDIAIQRQQLETHFQPIINLTDGTISAIEARVRWNRGIGQLLTASEVLEAAIAVQAHWMLDRAVLERARQALEKLKTEYLDEIPVTVNISANTCTNEEAASQLEQFLAGSGINPGRLTLEFPQEALIKMPDQTISLARQLAKQNFTIVVDHVDCTSLDKLHISDIPVAAIKVHEDIVKPAPSNEDKAKQVHAICKQAQQLRVRVIAEGIVRLEQLDFLRQAGCVEGQGPLISRPRSLSELMFLLRKGRCW